MASLTVWNVRDLRTTFEDQDWLLSIKNATTFGSPEVTQGDIKWLQKDYQDLIVDRLAWVLDDRGAVLRTQEWMDWSILILMIVGAFRFLQHLHFQKLLNTLTSAISSARNQMLHTFIILAVVLMGFTYTGHILLSTQVPQYRGNSDSWRFTVNLAFGKATLAFPAMQNIGFLGQTFALAIKILVIGIAVKMVTALVITAYKDLQKENTDKTRGLNNDFKMMCYLGGNDTFSFLFRQCLAKTCHGCFAPEGVPPRVVYTILEKFDEEKEWKKMADPEGEELDKKKEKIKDKAEIIETNHAAPDESAEVDKTKADNKKQEIIATMEHLLKKDGWLDRHSSEPWCRDKTKADNKEDKTKADNKELKAAKWIYNTYSKDVVEFYLPAPAKDKKKDKKKDKEKDKEKDKK